MLLATGGYVIMNGVQPVEVFRRERAVEMSSKVPILTSSALIIITIILGVCGAAVAQQADTASCGPPPPPEVQKEISDTKKTDLEGRAQALSKLLGSGELVAKIESERKSIYQTTNESEAILEDRYLVYMACLAIMGDKTATLKEKMEFIQTLRKPRTQSEQPDKTAYIAGERRSDLRTVKSYLPSDTSWRSNDILGCEELRSSSTKDIFVDDKRMLITNLELGSFENCDKTAPLYYLDESSECSANISDLDEILEVPACCPPTACGLISFRLSIRCLSGGCVSCRVERKKYTDARNKVESTRASRDVGLTVFLSDYVFFSRDQNVECAKLDNFARALSRIISYGSDKEFCKAHPSYCHQ
jgi:hypothetical protein